MDAQVKFIRLLGVSPETGEEEIRRTFMDVGIGEVIEIKKVFLDAGRLPGVTNGTWTLRVKFFDSDKVIPSYIHRRDEGELWSLNFEGRVFCCWKCGSGTHVGDKCRDQTRTFDEVFSEVDTYEGESLKPTWAAVVRSGQGESEEHKSKVKEIEKKLKEDNIRKDREKEEMENQKKLEEEEIERQKLKVAAERQHAIDRAAFDAKQIFKVDDDEIDSQDDFLMLKVVENVDTVELVNVSQIAVPASDAGMRASLTAVQHVSWLEARAAARQIREPMTITVHPDLEQVFGPGATRLAIGFQEGGASIHCLSVLGEGGTVADGQETQEGTGQVSDSEVDDQSQSEAFVASTPKRRRSRGRVRRRGRNKTGSMSPIKGSGADRKSESGSDWSDVEMNCLALGSSFVTSGSDSMGSDNKKLRLDLEVKELVDFSSESVVQQTGVQGEDKDTGILSGTESDMDTRKEEGSSQDDELSSEVAGDVLLPGSPGGENGGGL